MAIQISCKPFECWTWEARKNGRPICNKASFRSKNRPTEGSAERAAKRWMKNRRKSGVEIIVYKFEGVIWSTERNYEKRFPFVYRVAETWQEATDIAKKAIANIPIRRKDYPPRYRVIGLWY